MATSEASTAVSDKPANKLEVIKKTIHDFLHEKNSFTYVFELAEKYTKLSREYIFLGGHGFRGWCSVTLGGDAVCV